MTGVQTCALPICQREGWVQIYARAFADLKPYPNFYTGRGKVIAAKWIYARMREPASLAGDIDLETWALGGSEIQ